MSLFQNAVVTKYLQALNQDSISQKWNEFTTYFHNSERQENIRNSKEEQYQEGFLRELFVKILGYTLNPEPNFNLTTEYKNIKDSKKADGAIIVSEKVRAVIELKGTNTTDLGKIEAQAFGYKNNQPDCTYVITSNFEKIRFYIDNAIEHLEFNLFTLTEAEFKILYLCLAVENISKDIPKKVKDESVSQEDVITKKLYKDYSLFKRELFKNLVELNPNFDQLELFKKSQKLLDRFLFIFFAEDRMLLPPNSVRLILQQWKQLQDLDEYTPLYERFKKYFGYLNTGYKGKNYDVYAYNGGLFKPDEILDNITIDDNLLYAHTLKLSEYDFVSEVDVNILGHIFENSLNELDEIKAQLEGQEIDKTKTKRKKDGVFYTPKYITKYIVENTIGKLCEEKKLELAINEEDYITDKKRQKKTIKDLVDKLDTYRKWLLQLTICDPACGSGAFLNQALDFLIEEHQYIDELQAKLFGDALVLTDMENSILENNLFGVDLNEESVEIAKLSLWLRTAQPNRKLNDLSGNIKCGNSLIDDPEIAGDKAFNWQNAFPKVFEKGGFDVIIGNPPYVRQELFKDIKPYLEDNYKCYNSVADLYTYFIELGIKLINNNGKFSFILPNKFLKATYGAEIRKVIKNDSYLELIYDFDDYPVFEDATTYPLIFVISKKFNFSNFRYSSINKKTIEFPLDKLINNEIKVSYEMLKDSGEWNFISNKLERILEKINKDSITLSEYINNQVYLGIKTGKNEAFIIDKPVKDYILRENPIEQNLIFPIATGKEIYRYRYINNEKSLLFTKYDLDIRSSHPAIFNWLLKFETDLIKRGDKGKNWWNLRSCDYYDKITKPKIIWRSISNECGFYLDENGDLLLSNNNYFIASDNFTLLGILNSKLTFLILSNSCTTLQGGFFDFRRDKVLQVPISKKIDSIDSKIGNCAKSQQINNTIISDLTTKFQRTLQRKFEGLEINKKLESWYELTFAEFVKELGKKKIKLSLSEEAEWEDYFLQEQQKALALKQQITTTDQEIDKMVYELYGLTDEEIEIVENS
ncbi:Eco57I restriction-modification methylase domain-containing protein [Flavobacterium oreochromis]|uniref:Eco57I restriction-modification methylase domain-containing protein n=1 Tax=Flavobacterium oreochromis TaxID=2906078 RepID=UPI000B4DBE90|nr:DNA methyltransferase [Flavobacterium oreochromis]OWP75501.1 restriction endonuclease subunit M [Flavobacterium oreochromis]